MVGAGGGRRASSYSTNRRRFNSEHPCCRRCSTSDTNRETTTAWFSSTRKTLRWIKAPWNSGPHNTIRAPHQSGLNPTQYSVTNTTLESHPKNREERLDRVRLGLCGFGLRHFNPPSLNCACISLATEK